MQLPNTLTDEQSRALVEAIRLLARHGRAIREERERQQRNQIRRNCGDRAAGLANDNGTRRKECTDAR